MQITCFECFAVLIKDIILKQYNQALNMFIHIYTCKALICMHNVMIYLTDNLDTHFGKQIYHIFHSEYWL